MSGDEIEEKSELEAGKEGVSGGGSGSEEEAKQHAEETIEDATKPKMQGIRDAVERAYLGEVEEKEIEVVPEALVVGAGITGMYAALGIADAGFKAHLVERKPFIGGHMAQLDKTFPTLDCSACILTPRMVDVGRHPLINLMTYSEVVEVSGEVGNFKVKVRRKARYVDENKCTGCGMCAEACRFKNKWPNEFDEGLGKRSSIYIAFPQAVPAVYTVDPEHCMMVKRGKCGKVTIDDIRAGKAKTPCMEACGPGAINFDMKDEIVELNVGVIIIATGYDIIDPRLLPEYHYEEYPNVITGLEFERLSSASGPTGGKIMINGKEPKDAVFISCVGSRNKQLGYPYCSRVCCMYLAKHAHLLHEKTHGVKITILYQDVRAFGKGYEEFYDRVQSEGITYRRGLPGEIYQKPGSDRLVVRAEDTMLGETYELEADLVVLGVGLRPSDGTKQILEVLNLKLSPDKFFAEKHPKAMPIETEIPGVFIAGCAQGPKDIPDSVQQGKAAASAALVYLAKKKVRVKPRVVEMEEKPLTAASLQFAAKEISSVAASGSSSSSGDGSS